MRAFVTVLALLTSSVCWSAPITYSFSGYTTGVWVNGEDLDPGSPLIRADGTVITNGDSSMTGEIVFDPEAWRDGAGGTGFGDVLSWTFSTQGLTYHGSGGEFHYLDFKSNGFTYADELPDGGFLPAYLPDVCSIGFNFDGDPFIEGPNHFPIADFIGGQFFSALDLIDINDELTMQGLHGVITDLRVTAYAVPAPTPLLLLTAGLFFILAGRKCEAVNKKMPKTKNSI